MRYYLLLMHCQTLFINEKKARKKATIVWRTNFLAPINHSTLTMDIFVKMINIHQKMNFSEQLNKIFETREIESTSARSITRDWKQIVTVFFSLFAINANRILRNL